MILMTPVLEVSPGVRVYVFVAVEIVTERLTGFFLLR